MRKQLLIASSLAAMTLGIAACGNTMGERALSGGAIGAAGGAAVGAMTGGSPGKGAIIGGAAGAAVGAATTDRDDDRRCRRRHCD